MAGLKNLSYLLVLALFGLSAVGGLLLQKRRPSLLPDESGNDSDQAADYFNQELVQHLREEASRPQTTTPYPDRMLVGTTESPRHVGKFEVHRGPISVHPANYVRGILKRSSVADPDLLDIMPLGLNTLSDSTGVVISQRREEGFKVPTSTVRLYKTGARTERICNSNDSTKPNITVGCGDHYLFPGYNVILVQDARDCSWRFRHAAPELLVTLNGVKRHHGMRMYIDNVHVPTSLVRKGRTANTRSRRHNFRDLALSLPTDAQAEGISVEVCVPVSPEYELYAEYEAQEWQCCDGPKTACGLSMGSLDDPNFSIDTMPWEMVFTVTVKSATNPKFFLLSYCSGSLISSEWALTTASCILEPEKKNPGSVPFVTAAFGDSKDPAVPRYAVEEFIVYPTVSDHHDIALVRLASEVKRTPVCLPGYSKPGINADVIGEVGTVLGWVLDGEEHPYISTLQQKVIDSDECSLQLGKKLPPHMLCTVDSTHGKPCLADGDLLMGTDQFTLRGLSNPRAFCHNDYRTHTSVAHFMPWISNVTGIVMPF